MPRSKKVKKTEPEFSDVFVREIRVNYVPSTVERFTFTLPSQVADFVRGVIHDNSREHFVALYLDASNRVNAYSILSIGSLNFCVIHPREVFQRAMLAGARSIVVAHNHPSGNLTPSNEDQEVTRMLKAAGQMLKMELLDHVIVSDDDYLSLRSKAICW